MWPIVVHYTNWRASSSSVRLSWSDGSTDDNFFVSLSHFSPREGGAFHQLISESDYTGTANGHHGPRGTLPIANAGPAWCRADGLWDTNGFADTALSAQCDVPNWFNYGFRGALSVGTNWTLNDAGWNSFEAGRTPPQLTPGASRSSCQTRPVWVLAPSCELGAPPATGDWVETVPRIGVNGVDQQQVHDRIISFINRYGRDIGGGDMSVVVNIFLWDCAQRYTGAGSPAWEFLGASDNCASLNPDDTGLAGRVHLLAAVPMTILRSEVVMAGPHLHLTARWGGIFGDPGTCSTSPECALSPLMNSAFLVPGE
jgi:hypothetical protein